MKRLSFSKRMGFILGMSCVIMLSAQEQPQDTIGNVVYLKEIIQIAPINKFNALDQSAPLSTIDQILEENAKVNMIKRGAYAWEPNIDGLSSERMSVTIDGMQIWGACTDKMDPITSYVETFNLGEVEISNGNTSVHGNGYGAMNLRLAQTVFAPQGWSGSISTGYETNNQQKIASVGLRQTQEKFYANTNFTYRSAENYTNGKNEEVLFSGFNKFNMNLNAGYKINDNQSLHGGFIFDRATDVGYPALTMDVSLAQAYIGSLSFVQKRVGKNFTHWETKLYANTIHHRMDDTTRPNVPIHMDMPGWSTTMGAYSKIRWRQKKNWYLDIQLEGFQNVSKAEMTMYPNDPKEKIMYMYTWPNVETRVANIFAKEVWNIGKNQWNLSGKLTLHHARLKDDFGKNSIHIFYPDFSGQKTRFLKDFTVGYSYRHSLIQPYVSIGYSERAPSVSEGYGFYLFNSFDNFDYIGNPDLPNEKAWHGVFKLKTKIQRLSLKGEANFYRIKDYIIGVPHTTLSAMTIGATGIKVYENLAHADLRNIYISGSYPLHSDWSVMAHVSFHSGKDQNGKPLPLISPVQYGAQLKFKKDTWSGLVHFHGNGIQTEYSPSYGEDSTPGFHLLDISLSKQWENFQINASVNNLLNQYYSTYTDWNNIPRMGRNFIINLNYKF